MSPTGFGHHHDVRVGRAVDRDGQVQGLIRVADLERAYVVLLADVHLGPFVGQDLLFRALDLERLERRFAGRHDAQREIRAARGIPADHGEAAAQLALHDVLAELVRVHAREQQPALRQRGFHERGLKAPRRRSGAV